jgi:hypothetical protein
MENLPLEEKMHWLDIRSEGDDEIDRYLARPDEPGTVEKYVLIGRWYYYLSVHGDTIELHRTLGKIGQPSVTQVVNADELAISNHDLECAVNWWSCGMSEPGHYRISPLIERKLRILFE